MPSSFGAIVLLTFATALETPFPIQRFLSSSRSSTASFSPVEAPDGTDARPRAPLSSTTSTSTVGFPRESNICRPFISRIALIHHSTFLEERIIWLASRWHAVWSERHHPLQKYEQRVPEQRAP